MDKKQLIDLIMDMPDDLFVKPIEYQENVNIKHEWESQCRVTSFGGVYQRGVDNELVLRIVFKTRFEGEFSRSYTNPDGCFFNIRRIK